MENNKFETIEALIRILSTPIAKRKGVYISPTDCKEWIGDLKLFLEQIKK